MTIIDAIYILTKFDDRRISNIENTILAIKKLGIPNVYLVNSRMCRTRLISGANLLCIPSTHREYSASKRRPNFGNWDIGRKRSFIHRHAQCIGLNRITMIDDDIILKDKILEEHNKLISNNDIVSTIVGKYPDNSVVFHAAREVLGIAVARPSGALLSINVKHTSSTFLNVYNEDWFFFSKNYYCRRSIAGNIVDQLPYDPFCSPAYAAWQEFYDLIAEGILYNGGSIDALELQTKDFWSTQIRRRRKLQANIISKTYNSAILMCIEAASIEIDSISPEDCLDFCRTLRQIV